MQLIWGYSYVSNRAHVGSRGGGGTGLLKKSNHGENQQELCRTDPDHYRLLGSGLKLEFV